MIVGITGTIASGKSTVSKYFQEKKYGLLDADLLAKNLLEDREMQEELKLHFGAKLLNAEGSIDRKMLREIIFHSEKEREYLNNLLHPKIRRLFENQREKVKKEEIYFFDIPLLFEAKFDDLCDKVLLVSAQEKMQIDRIMKRDGSSSELAKAILAAQMPESQKRERADYIVENNGSLEELYRKLEEVEEKLHEDCSASRK